MMTNGEDDDVVASMIFIIGNQTIKIWAKTKTKSDGSVESTYGACVNNATVALRIKFKFKTQTETQQNA